MAEWLSHVLLGYAIFTILRWQIDWINQRWVAVGIVGSILPDLNRLGLLIGGEKISTLLGIPFHWSGLNTLGGSILLAAVGALLFKQHQESHLIGTHQRRAFGLLLAGALSHIVIDLPQSYADGRLLTNIYFFPFTSWRGSTPGWYVSADRWVAVVAVGIASVVYLADQYQTTTEPDR